MISPAKYKPLTSFDSMVEDCTSFTETPPAVMIASAGFYAMMAGDAAGLELNARPSIDTFGEQKGF